MANAGFWTDGLQGTVDRQNATLLQHTTTALKPTAGFNGRLWWSTDEYGFEYDDGSNWIDKGFPKVYGKSADVSITNDATLTADADLLFAAGSADDRGWLVELFIRYVSTANADFKWRMTGPTGTTFDGLLAYNNNSGVDTISDLAGGPNSATIDMLGTNGSFSATMIVFTTNTGNVTFDWAQNNSHADTTTVEKYSALRVTRFV